MRWSRLLLASSTWQTQCNHVSLVLPPQQSAFSVFQIGDCTQTLKFKRPSSTFCCLHIQCVSKVSPIKHSLIPSLLEATFCRPHSCYRPASVQSLGQVYRGWNRFQVERHFLSCSIGNGNGHCSGPYSKGLRGSDYFSPAGNPTEREGPHRGSACHHASKGTWEC